VNPTHEGSRTRRKCRGSTASRTGGAAGWGGGEWGFERGLRWSVMAAWGQTIHVAGGVGSVLGSSERSPTGRPAVVVAGTQCRTEQSPGFGPFAGPFGRSLVSRLGWGLWNCQC
jgi:hypothetical protein